MDRTPPRRFLSGMLKMLGLFGEKQDRSAFLAQGPPPEEGSASQASFVPVWTSPEGGEMHARWRGRNAKVWWPLKEQTQIVVVKKIEAEAVLCESGKALYQFFTPAVLQFMSLDDLGRAGHMRDLGDRLRVEVTGYQIVSADLVPREQVRSKKGIA